MHSQNKKHHRKNKANKPSPPAPTIFDTLSEKKGQHPAQAADPKSPFVDKHVKVQVLNNSCLRIWNSAFVRWCRRKFDKPTLTDWALAGLTLGVVIYTARLFGEAKQQNDTLTRSMAEESKRSDTAEARSKESLDLARRAFDAQKEMDIVETRPYIFVEGINSGTNLISWEYPNDGVRVILVNRGKTPATIIQSVTAFCILPQGYKPAYLEKVVDSLAPITITSRTVLGTGQAYYAKIRKIHEPESHVENYDPVCVFGRVIYTSIYGVSDTLRYCLKGYHEQGEGTFPFFGAYNRASYER